MLRWKPEAREIILARYGHLNRFARAAGSHPTAVGAKLGNREAEFKSELFDRWLTALNLGVHPDDRVQPGDLIEWVEGDPPDPTIIEDDTPSPE